ncbi:mitochondrial carrier [Rhizoclosmatium globosum]|uniref:Mitochondrial carrier n=1 Tax=Rhizoclosmatium globosum TaxID=329046 RepID=A0A1Y2BTV7_9FUNG|nr:mitochondrial carrier [Rhizoclosmatium globosum]|eukprot:ORY38198.1 mitochondrial carrier [Rhizoclosmatium globosum]
MSAPAKPVSSATTAAKKPKKNLAIHLLAGGVAGCCEALTCHPLDTIKVRLQLRGERAGKMNGLTANFIQVGTQIVQKEGFFSLYKGLGAVLGGIVPKMAIRFSSFEAYKDLLADKQTGSISSAGIFIAGLGAGITESVLVVTPMDVIKIRLQAQRHSMTDPLDIPKYRNAPHCAYVMIKEEGFGSLYKGVALTALRQSTNQAANFTVYSLLKSKLEAAQGSDKTLPAYQHLLMGFVSGACGPLFNAPIDVIKTRIQKTPSKESGWVRFTQVTSGILKNEGWTAFYKGTTPRVLRVAPGQAITFMVYERVYKWMTDFSKSMSIVEAERVGITTSESNEA